MTGNALKALIIIPLSFVTIFSSPACGFDGGEPSSISHSPFGSKFKNADERPVQIKKGFHAEESAEVALKNENNYAGKKRGTKRTSVQPTLATMLFKDGLENAFGPGLDIKHRISTNEIVTFDFEYLPLKFKVSPEPGKIKYSYYKLRYNNQFRKDMFFEFDVRMESFNPDDELKNYVAKRNGVIEKKSLVTPTISIGKKIFDLKLNFMHKKYVFPMYLKLSYSFSENYSYGTKMGDAGSEFRIKNGFKLNLVPITRKF